MEIVPSGFTLLRESIASDRSYTTFDMVAFLCCARSRLTPDSTFAAVANEANDNNAKTYISLIARIAG